MNALKVVPAINGVTLHAPGDRLDPESLSELAWGELLRQEAVRQGLLPRLPVLCTPPLTEQDQHTIQSMLNEAVPRPTPGEEESRRYYDSNKQRFLKAARSTCATSSLR